MWVCTSCMMENDDSDLNCYMCGEKRPHIAQVRKAKEPQAGSEPVASPEPVAKPAAEPKSVSVSAPAPVIVPSPIAEEVPSAEPSCDLSDFSVQTEPQEDKTSGTLIFDMGNETIDKEETTVVNPFSWHFTPPVPADKPQQEDEPDAEDDVIVIEQARGKSEANRPPVLPDPPAQPANPLPSVEDVFGIFSSSFQHKTDESAPWQNQVPPPPYTPPEPTSPTANRKDKGSAESKVFSFASVLFVVSLFVWLFAVGFLGIIHFFEGDADIPYMLDTLRYVFETKVYELIEIEIPALADKIMNLIGSL